MNIWSATSVPGTQTTEIVVWVFAILLIFLGGVLAFALGRRLRNNSIRDRLAARTPVYRRLLEDLGSGHPPSDEDVRAEIPRRDFEILELFLRDRLSAKDAGDPASERRLAEACGFLPFVRKRARSGRGWARAANLHALALLRDRADLDLFRNALEKDPHRSCVFAGAFGLARGGEAADLPLIVRRLYNPAAPNRDELLLILSACGATQAPGLLGFLRSPDLPEPAAGVLADVLGIWKYAPACAVLEERLSSARDGDFKCHLIEALEKVGARSTCDRLRPYLQDPDFRVRLKAVNALERLGGAEFLGDARATLADPSHWVRRNAAEALLRMGGDGRQVLQEVARSTDDGPRRAAKLALAENQFKRIRWRFRYAESVP